MQDPRRYRAEGGNLDRFRWQPSNGIGGNLHRNTHARRSISVLAELGVEIQWVESFICGDKIYCVYLAADEELIREHGRLTGIPCNSILQISKVIDPCFGFFPI